MTNRKFFSLLPVLLLALALAGCAAIEKVEGEQTLNNKLQLKLPEAWNKLNSPGQPYQVWTQEGASLDQLRLWAGLETGKQIATPPPARGGQEPPRVPTFTAGMTLDQLVSLFEVMYAADGSQVKVTKIEPALFAGTNGVRFEMLVTMKKTDLQFKSMGWAAIRNNELFAATFHAPEAGFFKRLAPKAEVVMKAAAIR